MSHTSQRQFAEAIMDFFGELKHAVRSLVRAKGLTATVIATLALGIGANAAIFALVRGVLLRPLVNRDEDRLIYIRQTAHGIGVDNTLFSVPEILDLRSRIKTLSSLGDFSTIGFTMVGLGEPREVSAGVVGGSLLAGSIRSMMGGGGNHQAFGDTGSHSGGIEDRRPWSDQSGGSLARDAGINDIGSSSRRADNNDYDSGSQQGFFDSTSDNDDDMDHDSDGFDGDDGDGDYA